MSPTCNQGASTIHDATAMLPYSDRVFFLPTRPRDDFWPVFNMAPTVSSGHLLDMLPRLVNQPRSRRLASAVRIDTMARAIVICVNDVECDCRPCLQGFH